MSKLIKYLQMSLTKEAKEKLSLAYIKNYYKITEEKIALLLAQVRPK